MSLRTLGCRVYTHLIHSFQLQPRLLPVPRLALQRTCCLSNEAAPKESSSSPLIDGKTVVTPSQIYEDSKVVDAIIEESPSEDAAKKLRVLCLEHEVWRQEGTEVPSFLRVDQWRQLLTMDTRSRRKKFFKYLFGIEMKKLNEKAKKEERAQNLEAWRITREKQKEEQESDQGPLKYGLDGNNIMLRIYESTMNQMYNNNLIRAIQFGQKLVFDCGYDEYMTPVETINCAKQIMMSFAENRVHVDPYDLHLCNAKKDNPTMKSLFKFIPTLYEDYFPLNVHEGSYLDLFPKQDLVYLTPHCRQELQEFDRTAVYIVGAIVDKTNCEPLSLAKAKREGLQMAKLPLDKYLHWGGGSGKSLTLNQMIAIMLNIRRTGDWDQALRHVPRRKIVKEEAFASQPPRFGNRKTDMPQNSNFRPRRNPDSVTNQIFRRLKS